MSSETKPGRTAAIGVAAALSAVLIGAGWQVVTRLGVTTTVDAYDLALMRYVVPALLLAPLLVRHGLFPRGVSPGLVIAMVAGGGLPFGLLVMQAARMVPVSHIGVLVPGMMPIFVAVLAARFLDEPITARRAGCFALILLGVTCIGGDAVGTMSAATLAGDGLLLTAAFLWGVYSVAFRRSGLSPWHAAAIIAFWSALLVAVVWGVAHGDGLWRTPPALLALQIVWQGVLAGAVGMWVYGLAMKTIGAARAAAIGALVPALAVLGGWVVLAERPTALTALGVAITVVGVATANRAEGPREDP